MTQRDTTQHRSGVVVDFHDVAESLHDGVLVYANGKTVFANRRIAEMLGYSPDDVIGMTVEDVLHPSEAPLIKDRFRRRMLGEPVPALYETIMVSRTGESIPVEISASRTIWKGAPAGIGIIRDIRARKAIRAQMEQFNRLLQTVADIDALIARETGRQRLLEETCRMLVETGGYRSAWIGEVDGAKQEIRPIATIEALRQYVGELKIRCDDSPLGRGPAGMAVKTGRPQLVNDIDTDPTFAPWRHLAQTVGYRSLLAIPLRVGADHVTGVVNIHANRVNAFGANEVELLARMGDNLAHALRVMEDEEQRQRAERELRRTNALLENVFANTRVLLAQLDHELRIIRVNRAFVQARGHTAEFFVGQRFFDLYPEAEREKRVRAVLETGTAYVSLAQSFRWQLATGPELTYWDWNVSAVKDADRVTGIVLRLIDVTDRHNMEGHSRKLSSALEHTADSVIVTDRNGRIEYVNPAFEHGTGFSRSDAIGQTPRIVKSGRHDAAFYQELWRTILAGEVYRNVLINRKCDGTLYYEEKTITPIKDAEGAITHFVSTGRDITDRMHAQERLQYLAYHDVLTTLPNRALFMDRLEQALSRAGRGRNRLALMFLDIDRFKIINDTLGHDVGDNLLQSVAQRLRVTVRDVDTVARVSGDEFAILLDDVDSMDDLTAIARKLLEAFGKPFELPHRELFVTTSIGVSVFPGDGRDALTLLKNADTAMYRAKEAGRNAYQFYSADMSARAVERLALETGLRRVLEREELVLHYQPQIDIRSGRLLAAEALVRWRHPQLGLIQPGEFIGLLEDTGMILPVGEWVTRAACSQAREWQRMGVRDLRVTVNLSARQFSSPGLVDLTTKLLREFSLRPELLEFEITESVLMQHAPATIETLTRLADMGCRIAIDDFGTGYSSLAYLKRFPINVLKIDHTFVRDVPDDPDDAAIVTTIVAMAHSLKLEVVAEGVETEKQLAFLRACGCDAMQGHLFSRPLPTDDFLRFLKEPDARR